EFHVLHREGRRAASTGATHRARLRGARTGARAARCGPHARRAKARAVKPATRGAVVEVWLRNEAGRAGVPQRRSFETWVAAALRGVRRRRRTSVNILIADEPAARDFNRRYRGRDYATNVLSFPADPLPDGNYAAIGDLVLCAPV